MNRQLDPSYRTSSNGWSAARWTNGHEDGDRVSIGCGNRRLGSRSQGSWRALRCVYSANWDPPDKAQVSDSELSASHAAARLESSLTPPPETPDIFPVEPPDLQPVRNPRKSGGERQNGAWRSICVRGLLRLLQTDEVPHEFSAR